MAVGIYAGESMVYRTVGMMDKALNEVRQSSADAAKVIRKAIEEYAVECSIIKVWGSEMLDFVVDETVQIYGGYGFVEEYPAERAYRDRASTASSKAPTKSTASSSPDGCSSAP